MRSNFPTLAFSKETTAFIRTDGAAAAHHVIWEHAHQLADQMSVVLARSAGKDLSALFKRPTLTALTEAALEPDADRRMETAFYAAAHPDFVPYLMLLKNDPDPGVRSAVLIGLSGFEAVTALPQGWIDPRAEAIVTASGSEAALLAERLPRSEAVRSIRATLSSTAASDDKIFQSIVAARRLGYPELFPDLLNWLERDGQSRKFIFHHTPYLWSEVWANSGIVDVYPATVKLARQTLDELARSARRETRAAEVVIAAQASIRRAEQQKRWGFIIHVAAPLLLEADPAAYRRYVETRQYRTAVWMERSNYYAPLAIGFVSLILLFGLFKTFFINRHYPKKMLAGWRPPVSLPKRGKSSGGRPGPSAARMATQHLNIESEVENGGNRKDPVELLGRRIGEWESMTDTGRGMAAEDISLHILLIAQQIATSLPGKFNEEPLRLIWNGDDRQRALTHEQYYDALELMRDVLNRVLPKEYHLAESLPPAERLERLAVLDTAALHLARLVPALHAYVTIEDFKYFVRQFYEYRMPWFLEWLYAYGYLMKSTRKALIRVVGDYYRSVAVDPLLAESHVDVYLQKQDTEQRFMAASDRARAKTGKTRWGLGRRFRRLIAIVFPLGTSAVALAMSGWQLSLILGPAFALIGVAWHWYTAFGATEQLQNYIERKAFFDQTLSRYREMTGWNGSAETSGPASIPSVQQAAAALRDEALTAGEEALDLVLVMAGGDQSAHQERVRSTLEEQPVIQKTRARVILMPDHQTGSGSFLTMLAAHRKLKQGITLEALWSALAADPQIRQLNLRMDWDRTLPVSRRQKSLTPGQEGLRIAILYAGGPDDQRTRSRQQLEAAAERILSTAAIAWNDRKSLVMNLSADIRYEGPGPIFGWEGNFGRPGEIFLPSVLASPGQINEENLDVVLPSYDGKVYQVFVPRGHVEEIKDELAEKDTRHASPVRVMNSEHPNFRQLPVATKLWTFAPSDSILNLIHAMDAAMSREELKPAFAALNQRMGHGSVARLFLSIVAQWQSGDTNLADAIRDTLQAADPSGLNMELIRSFESLKTVFGRLLREYDKTSIPTIRTVISPDPASVSRPAVDADFLPVSRVVSAVSENPAVVAPPVRMIHETPRYRLTVLLNSFILLKEDSAGGREVILSPANGRFQGRTADGAEWIGMFRDAEKKHFVIAEDGAEVPLAEISDKTFSRLTALLVSGARLAQPSRSNNIWASINRGFWNSAAAPDPKFKPRYLIGQEPSGAANKENEKQALIALLRFMTSEGDVSGSAVDAWIDLVIRMGLPKVEPFRLERGSDGYSWGSPAARGTSPEISKAMGSLKLALTASDRGSARDRAFEAARTLLDFIAGSADISAARIHLKKAFSGFGRSYRVAIQRRLALPPNGAVNAGVLPQRILIKEDLFLENLNFFKSENDLLTNRLKKFGQTLPVVIIAGLTDELRKLAPAERKAAYRRSHDFGGDFDILFLDLDSEEDRALLESGRSDRQALLTRASSTAARYLFSVKTSVIVAEPVEGAAYTGILFASARHLIEGRQSLPGMKKITDGYYRYLPPLRPGELLRLITDAAQSLESTAASA